MPIAPRIVKEIPTYKSYSSAVESHKQNVTYYARVSTDNIEQEDSYERQKEHFTQKILARPDWNYVDGYADKGITGTKAESRKEFMRMIEDCRAGKIDRILVKSVSRFARNTVDTLKYIRELKDLGISIYFETQNIDTLTPGGEILITILAAMAEQESRTMSTNIKWAYQKRFKDGDVLISYRNTLGYTKEGKKGYAIVDSEAEIVRRIYREYLTGRTMRDIAKGLNSDGITTKLGNRWQANAVEGILGNEKYTGNAILGKSYKPDVLSKKRLNNDGQAPSYYVENSHPAIISQETFDMVQAERLRRHEMRSSDKTGKGKYSSMYAYSGLLICGECGGKLRRFGRRLANGETVRIWLCITHQHRPDLCKVRAIKELDIDKAYERAVKRLLGDMSEVVDMVKKNIEAEVNVGENGNLAPVQTRIEEIQEEIHDIFRKRRNWEISKEEYNSRYAALSEEYSELHEKELELKDADVQKQMTQKRLLEIADALGSEETDFTDDTIKRLLLDCIKVVSKNEIEFQFKCGVTLTEKL